jgi:hypothetical protein
VRARSGEIVRIQSAHRLVNDQLPRVIPLVRGEVPQNLAARAGFQAKGLPPLLWARNYLFQARLIERVDIPQRFLSQGCENQAHFGECRPFVEGVRIVVWPFATLQPGDQLLFLVRDLDEETCY